MAVRAPLRRNENFFKQDSSASTERKVQQAFQRCATTGTLNLSEQKLSGDLPASVCGFQEASWAENWWDQYPVTKIDVSHNLLERIPPEIANLSECAAFVAVSNQLRNLPDELFTALPLKQLNLKQNLVDTLPGHAIAQAAHLVEIVLSENKLLAVPDEIFAISTLEIFDVSSNRIRELPNSEWRCNHLRRFDVSGNALGPSLPSALRSCCTTLRELCAAGNTLHSVGDFFDVPADHGWRSSLVQLDLSLNQIGPSLKIAALTSLDTLNITSNKISHLGLGPGAFPQLGNVLAGTNMLDKCPEGLLPASAPKLGTLDLSNNNLTSLPPELGLSQALKRVALEGNALRSIRPDLLRGGAENLKAYLRSRISDQIGTEGSSVASARSEDPLDSLTVELRTAAATKELILDNRGLSVLPALPNSMRVLQFPRNSLTTASLCKAICAGGDASLQQLRILRCPRNSLGTDSGSHTLLFCLLQNLPALQELDLSTNQIVDVGMVRSCALTHNSLVHLDLSSNLLTELPTTVLAACSILNEIRLRQNFIETLENVAHVSGSTIGTLDLEENRLSSVPPWLPSALPKLRTILLANNAIGPTLPPEWGFWESLQAATFSGNPLRGLRQSLLSSGWPAVAAYLRDRLPSGAPASAALPKHPVLPSSSENSADHGGNNKPSKQSLETFSVEPAPVPQAAVTSRPVPKELAERLEKLRTEISGLEEELAAPGLSRGRQSSLTHSLRMKRAENMKAERELKRIAEVADGLETS